MTLLADARPPPLFAGLIFGLKSFCNTNDITLYEITGPDAILALADPYAGHILQAKEAPSRWETASLGWALQLVARRYSW